MRSTASNPHRSTSPRQPRHGEVLRRRKSSSDNSREHPIASVQPGVFYRHPGPGKPPYVSVGDPVDVGQTIGLVEMMKQYTDVVTTASGVVDRFTVDDCSEVCAGTVVAVVRDLP